MFVAVWGEFIPTLEDVAQLTMLLVFGNQSPIGIVLEGEDEAKHKYLTSAMTVSRMFGKSTYARLYFDEGENRCCECVVEDFLIYWLSCLPSEPEDGLNPYIFPLTILLAKGRSWHCLHSI